MVLCENTFSDIGHTEKKGIYLLNVSTQEVLCCDTWLSENKAVYVVLVRLKNRFSRYIKIVLCGFVS